MGDVHQYLQPNERLRDRSSVRGLSAGRPPLSQTKKGNDDERTGEHVGPHRAIEKRLGLPRSPRLNGGDVRLLRLPEIGLPLVEPVATDAKIDRHFRRKAFACIEQPDCFALELGCESLTLDHLTPPKELPPFKGVRQTRAISA